ACNPGSAQSCGGRLQGPRFKATISMQEKQRISRSLSGTRIHLQAAAARRLQDQVCLPRNTRCGITTPAIRHNDFMCPLSAQRLKRVGQAAFLVKGRYDNGDLHAFFEKARIRTIMPEPWYHEGLQFRCTRCGKCCTGEPGNVWENDDEIAAIARLRGESTAE